MIVTKAFAGPRAKNLGVSSHSRDAMVALRDAAWTSSRDPQAARKACASRTASAILSCL